MNDTTDKITGGCLCGAVRYELSEPPIETGTCHCRMCQIWTGSAFMVMARFPRSALRFTKGEPKLYRSSPIKDKGFCADCGSPLFDRYLVWKSERTTPDMVWIQVGTLDHPEAVSLDFHYGVETQLPWVHFDDGLPRTRCDEDPTLAAAFAAAEAGGEEPVASQFRIGQRAKEDVMGDRATPITGGCLCGAVRYEASEPLREVGLCHCRVCQRTTGSAFAAVGAVPRTAFRLTGGEPKQYRSSSIMEKWFCPECGGRLFDRYLVPVRASLNPDNVWLHIGTLDEPEAVPIEDHYGVESQLPWVQFDDDLPRARCDEDPALAAAFAAATKP